MKLKIQSIVGLRKTILSLSTMAISLSCALTAENMAVAQDKPAPMRKVRIADDSQTFVLGESSQVFVPWGFNYLGQFGKLAEDSWDSDWERISRDFQAVRQLGANVVRVHLQFATYMLGPDEFDQAQLDRLRKMLDLASQIGLYLDITGLSCYRLDRIPAWYDELDESERWVVQERWWKTIAHTCAGHPAVFCYDLMNEPIVVGPAKAGEPRWVTGELGGLYFVQRISEAPGDRTSNEIAEAWVAMLTAAIREQDTETPITVGVIPWALVWPNAKPLFYSPEAAKHLDFVSIHVYPDKDKVNQAIAALAVYDIGKPLVVEEIFPMNCTIEELDRFIDGGRERVDGWISHYFGYTIEEHLAGAEPVGAAVGDFFKYWRDKGKSITAP